MAYPNQTTNDDDNISVKDTFIAGMRDQKQKRCVLEMKKRDDSLNNLMQLSLKYESVELILNPSEKVKELKIWSNDKPKQYEQMNIIRQNGEDKKQHWNKPQGDWQPWKTREYDHNNKYPNTARNPHRFTPIYRQQTRNYQNYDSNDGRRNNISVRPFTPESRRYPYQNDRFRSCQDGDRTTTRQPFTTRNTQ